MITVKNADAALKDYYLDAVSGQLNGGISPFFNAIEKSAENVCGKDVKIAVARGFTGNIIAGAEDGDLPDPRQGGARFARVVGGVCQPFKRGNGSAYRRGEKQLRADAVRRRQRKALHY